MENSISYNDLLINSLVREIGINDVELNLLLNYRRMIANKESDSNEITKSQINIINLLNTKIRKWLETI